MTTIARLTQVEAYLLKGRLEAEQIPAFVLDEHSNTGLPLIGDSFAGLRVQVAEEHLERAQAVVRAIRGDAPDTNTEIA
jgi:Putative prokaryotic signal transducing protein